jgi:hypothetical protein
VILALAILAASLAVLGQLVQIGMTHARQAEDLTQAVIACESIMAEVVSGVRSPASNEFLAPYDEIVDDDGNAMFAYSIVVGPSETQAGMLDVHVIVERDPSSAVEPVSCELVRWIVDPDYVASLSGTATN